MTSRRGCGLVGCTLLAVAMIWTAPGAVLGQEPGGQRAPVPPTDAQNKVLQLIREVFKKEYEGAKTSAEKGALAADLYKRAVQCKDSTERFVLLRVSRDMAALAGDAELACQAIDAIAQRFEVDPATMKKEVLTTLAEKASTQKQYKAIAEQASTAMDDAIAEEAYEMAGQLAETALAAVRKAHDSTLTAQVTARTKEIAELAKSRAEIKQAMDSLEKSPGDPKANLAVGRYYCLLKGDWEKGLPMLALAADEAYSPLAKKELLGVKTPEEQVALADAWWDLGEKSDAAHQRQLRNRAAYWYEKARSNLSGLTKMRVQKRLDEIAAADQVAEVDTPETPTEPGETPKTIRKKRKPTFEGTWRDRFNNIIDFKVEGRSVVGTYKNVYTSRYSGEEYTNYEGRIAGTVSRDGQTLTGEWARSPSYLAPDDAGTLVFQLSKNGAAFAGTFTFGPATATKIARPWNGVRVK